MVYDQPDHAVLNRWLVLADPDEATPTVQGKYYFGGVVMVVVLSFIRP